MWRSCKGSNHKHSFVLMSNARKKNWKDTAYRSNMTKKIRDAAKMQWSNPTTRRKMCAAMRVTKATPGGYANHARGRRLAWKDPKYRKKAIKGIRLSHKDPEVNRKIQAGLNARPTTPEILTGMILKEVTQGEFSYNGDFSSSVHVDGLVPDFVSKRKKLAIEVNGDYWHRNEDLRKTRRRYQKEGYKLLVIWESELNGDWEKVTRKIKKLAG